MAGGSGVTLSLGAGSRPRKASRRAKQRDLTASSATKRVSDTCTTRERTCASDVQHKYTAQAAHAHVRSHDTPTWFHSLTDSVSHSLRARRGTPCNKRAVRTCTHGQPRPKNCVVAASSQVEFCPSSFRRTDRFVTLRCRGPPARFSFSRGMSWTTWPLTPQASQWPLGTASFDDTVNTEICLGFPGATGQQPDGGVGSNEEE